MLNQYNLPLPRLLLLEADALSYTSVIRLQTALNMPKIANISQKMREIRAIKSDFELNQIRESAKIHAEVYSQIPAIYRPGMTDIDFQIELEYIMRKAGSLGIFSFFRRKHGHFYGKHPDRQQRSNTLSIRLCIGGRRHFPTTATGCKRNTTKKWHYSQWSIWPGIIDLTWTT